jgi:hydrogenase expression/formation protein HypE
MSEIVADFLEKLRTMENGKHAAIIGEVVKDHPKQVMATSGIGRKRVVSMLAGEQLPRIC